MTPKTPAAGETAPFPFPTADHHPASEVPAAPVVEEPTEDAIDRGIEESFPASDPVSVTVTRVVPKTTTPGSGSAESPDASESKT
ncbi:MAG: hypothetical protein EOO24_19600 [Comamonadaceae bacterium]|nr:MAG: hypothetical protein EOO24_19600 [Comamonadaceae bacterium]